MSGAAMSEHPELREEMAAVLANQPLWSSGGADADALLALPAGPVGKLQAELAEAQSRLDDCQQLHDIRMDQLDALADPERIRREAIGAWVQAHDKVTLGAFVYRNAALAAGESAVTGEARPRCPRCSGWGDYIEDDMRTMTPCPDCAVTGEAQ